MDRVPPIFLTDDSGHVRKSRVKSASTETETTTRTVVSTTDGGQAMLKNAQIVAYIPVADVARARKFYEQKVGLQPKEEYAGGVVYECGKGSWVFMYRSPGAGTSKASTAFW